jgi:hypothetical protein
LNEVINLIKGENFDIIEYIAVNANNIPLEKAEKRKMAINIAFILRKKTNQN